MSYEEKLLNFVFKLYSKLGEDPSVQDACKGQNIVIELRLKDVPDVVWQVGAKNDKWFVNKGALDNADAVIEYLKLKYAADWWARKMSIESLFTQGAVAVLMGTVEDLMFLAPIEEPLQTAFQELKSEFPGQP